MGHEAVLLVIMLCYQLLFVGTVQSTRNPSKEELDMQIHTKLLNKSSIKTLKERCHFQNPRSWNQSFDSHSGEMQLSKAMIMETTNRANTYLAIARTKVGPPKYSGAGSYIKVDNPKAAGLQYSAARMKLQIGADNIEAGWRVDPSLYGDSRPHLFIRTDAGHTHCFNTRCAGFIQTFPGISFNDPITNISTPGGHEYAVQFYIIKDNRSGNWNLLLGEHPYLFGYWPSHIFTRLAGLAERVEWGGVAYSPPNTPLPPMGSGNQPTGDPAWDGFITRMTVLNERGLTVDASDLETYAEDSKLYSVLDCGYQGHFWGHIILYGGSGNQ